MIVAISVAIMAHPKREAFIPSIIDTLDSDATIVWDTCNDRWDTGRRSMLAYQPQATHHLVLQDDVIVCRDLVAALTAAVENIPADAPVGLYIGNLRPRHMFVEQRMRAARRARSPWLVMEGPWWGPGIVVPTSVIEPMVAWCDQRTEIANYDRRISRYFAAVGIDCWYTVPSLVNHRVGHPSLIEGRTGRRHARSFIGARSALEIDWSASPTVV